MKHRFITQTISPHMIVCLGEVDEAQPCPMPAVCSEPCGRVQCVQLIHCAAMTTEAALTFMQLSIQLTPACQASVENGSVHFADMRKKSDRSIAVRIGVLAVHLFQ